MGTGNLIGQLRALEERRLAGDHAVRTVRRLTRWMAATAWRVGMADVLPGELYFNEFYQPGLLADLLAVDRRRCGRSRA